MTDFIIGPTNRFPFVHTNAKEQAILISGIAITENPNSFFMPLETWLNDYLAHHSNTLTINFEMDVYSSATHKYFYHLFHSLAKHHNEGKNITVYWYYKPANISIKEDGAEFLKDFQFPIKVLESKPLMNFSHKKTDRSPLVYYDQSGDIIIEGNSTDNNPWTYYYPLIQWVEISRYSQQLGVFDVEFWLHKVDDINLQFINYLIYKLHLAELGGKLLEITWKYSNDEMKNLGLDCLKNYNFKHSFRMVE